MKKQNENLTEQDGNLDQPNVKPSLPLVKGITGCNHCGGKLVFIRGKYPKEEQREICPTCAYERLEEIYRMSDPDYMKTYCSSIDTNGNGA